MGIVDTRGKENFQKALAAVDRNIGLLFSRAPVMMHSIDSGGRLVKVNRRWLQRMGYKRKEVLGRRSVDFLTEESRTRATNATLPHFWQTGAAHSIGYQLVTKEGTVLHLLLDAVACPVTSESCSGYAALYDADDLGQWEQATATLRALQHLTDLRSNLESLLFTKGSHNPDPAPPVTRQPLGSPPKVTWTEEALGALLEAAQDISGNLGALVRAQEEWQGTSTDQQRDLVLVAKNIDRTLRDLADTTAAG